MTSHDLPLGQFTPSSPHGFLPVVVWDSTVDQISTLFPAMSLTPMVLVEKMTLLPPEPGVWLIAPLCLKALDRGFLGFLIQGHRLCLSFKFAMHQTEDYWISSQFLSCLCSPPLLQAANCLHPTWVLVEEHKRAKSANPLNMTVRQLSVLLPFAVAHCKS